MKNFSEGTCIVSEYHGAMDSGTFGFPILVEAFELQIRSNHYKVTIDIADRLHA